MITFLRLFTCMSLLATVPPSGLAADAPRVFPAVTGKALTGDPFTVPDDLSRPFTFIVVAFEQEQQAAVDTWIPAMEALEDAREDFAFYEFPTIKEMNPVLRWVIHRGMRGGIKIGVGMRIELTPPSEPDVRISRIRLSG
jgi:hypothetical protein